MQSKFLFCVVFALCVSSAFAHFKLVAPPTRGFTAGTEADEPCGGYNTPSNTRTVVSDKYSVVLDIYDGNGTVEVNFAAGSNANATFTNIYTFPVETGTENTTIDVPANLAGQSGILQVIFKSDETFYQCADVSFEAAATTGTTTGAADKNAVTAIGVVASLVALAFAL